MSHILFLTHSPQPHLTPLTFDDSHMYTYSITSEEKHISRFVLFWCFMCIRGKNNGIKRHKIWARLFACGFPWVFKFNKRSYNFYTHKQMFFYRKNTLPLSYVEWLGLRGNVSEKGKRKNIFHLTRFYASSPCNAAFFTHIEDDTENIAWKDQNDSNLLCTKRLAKLENSFTFLPFGKWLTAYKTLEISCRGSPLALGKVF